MEIYCSDLSKRALHKTCLDLVARTLSPREHLSKLSSHPSGVRLVLNKQPRVSLALHPGLISCQPSGLASCTPGVCER